MAKIKKIIYKGDTILPVTVTDAVVSNDGKTSLTSCLSSINLLFTGDSANKSIKLANVRSIWGQSFDGTADISTTMPLHCGDLTATAIYTDDSGVYIDNPILLLDKGAEYNIGESGGRFGTAYVNNVDASDSIMIGSAKLTYDAATNSLKLAKADGTSINLLVSGEITEVTQ